MNHRRDLIELAGGVLVLAAAVTCVYLFVTPDVRAIYFGWPAGAVWSNLVASLICAVLIWWRVRARMLAHHAQALAQARRHHAEAMTLAAAHHQALKDHITAIAEPGEKP